MKAIAWAGLAVLTLVSGSSAAVVAPKSSASSPREQTAAATPAPVCTMRVVAMDPKLDPGMAKPVDRNADPRMTIPSHCHE
jgi:hypothetical protein